MGGELVHTKRDGTQVVVASRWSLQRDQEGRPAGVLETNNDITERKRAEETLRRSEAYLAESQRLTYTGSWALNVASRRMIHASEELLRLFGFDPQRAFRRWTNSSSAFTPTIEPERANGSSDQSGKEREANGLPSRSAGGALRYIYS